MLLICDICVYIERRDFSIFKHEMFVGGELNRKCCSILFTRKTVVHLKFEEKKCFYLIFICFYLIFYFSTS